jgi:uncharacterized membrane protein (DUF2068 family)
VRSPTSVRGTKAAVGLRAVASFEAAKGLIVLLLACGLIHLIHKDVGDLAERLTHIFHANPEGKLSNLFIELANHTTDRTLWVPAMGAVVYAAVRSVEAYGLWREREWAQWFELLSTALYLPPELYSLIRHPGPLKSAVLVTNIMVLMFMLVLRANAVRPQSRGA